MHEHSQAGSSTRGWLWCPNIVRRSALDRYDSFGSVDGRDDLLLDNGHITVHTSRSVRGSPLLGRVWIEHREWLGGSHTASKSLCSPCT